MMSLKKVVYYANKKNKLLTNFDLKANEQLCKNIRVFTAYCSEVRVQCCQLPVGASSDRLTPQLLHAEVRYDRFHLWDQHCLIDSTVGRS